MTEVCSLAEVRSPLQLPERSPSLKCFFGHHKCASTWIRRIVRSVSVLMGMNETVVHNAAQILQSRTLQDHLLQTNTAIFCYTNADVEQVKQLKQYRGVHVIRDPRDIIVSAYYSHLYSHPLNDWPELALQRTRLQSVDKDEGLILTIQFLQSSFALMSQWDYSNPDVLELKMEDLIADPLAGFLAIFRFWGLLHEGQPRPLEKLAMGLNQLNQRGRSKLPFGWPLSPIKVPLTRISSLTISEIVKESSFERLTGGRSPGQQLATSHYRNGKPGDWMNHLKPDHIIYFNKLYGDLPRRLGYTA